MLMKLVQEAMQYLEQVIDEQYGGNVSRAAQDLGVPAQTLYAWVKYKTRTPNLKILEPVLEKLNVRFQFPDRQSVEYDFVPKHAAKAGAGASLETSEKVEGLYAFRKDWMCAHGIYASSAVLLDVTGDSMEPLLREGDTLLIDKRDTTIMDGKIYVVTLGDELRVKRMYRSLSGVILRSENACYPDVNVDGDALETLRIHGRVRWCGKLF
jgi:phage repressor protein C with HTH and peptisase S24 domain